MNHASMNHATLGRWTRYITALACVAAGALCTSASAQANASSPARTGTALRAVVTVPALKSFVEPLLPAGSEVRVLMTPGRSEHGQEFTPSDLAALAAADLVVYVGLNLEPRVEEAVAKPVKGRQVVCFGRVVGLQKTGEPVPNTPEALAKAPGAPPHRHDHGDDDHDHGAESSPGWVDQHLWLDPVLVQKLIPAVRGAVEEALQDRGAFTTGERERLAAAQATLAERVKGTDEAWKAGLSPLAGRAIVTHHRAFSRPAERYGLRVVAAIREREGAEPTPADVAAVLDAISTHHVRAIFVEPQFDPQAAQRIASRAKVRVGRLDPMGSGDWFKMMSENLDSLVKNLKD